MLTDIQDFIDKKINGVTSIKKRFIDNLKIIESIVSGKTDNDNANQVVIRLLDRQDTKRLSDGKIISSVFTFDIWIIGNQNKTYSRNLGEQCYYALNSKYNIEQNNTIINITNCSGLSFQFEENENAVNKFRLELTSQTK